MRGNNITKATHIPKLTITKVSLTYNSISSQDNDLFLCSKIERHNNLPFDNVIATSKETKHTRILFQKVNSLEISSGYNTLELICDSIGQLEIDIVCLVEITTHWKYPREEASLKVTSNRHWRYSHISTSQTEIKWTGLCIL